MTDAKELVGHVLEQSNAAIRAELTRLETERKRMTGAIDQRIGQLRSILATSGMTPLIVETSRAPVAAEIGGPDEKPADPPSELPRGKTQRRIFEFLSKNKSAGYRELAAAVYGEYNDNTYGSIRNAVRMMKESGWMSGNPGEWTLGNGEAST